VQGGVGEPGDGVQAEVCAAAGQGFGGLREGAVAPDLVYISFGVARVYTLRCVYAG
jgi:hypothetical protein